MGRRGPPPKPTELKRLEGNPGKRALKDEPKPAPAAKTMEPPDHLNEHGKAEWRRRYPSLLACGLLTMADLPAFEVFCGAYGRWVEAELMLAKSAAVVTRNKEERANPWHRVSRMEREVMKAFMTEFGMTPASRARIGSATPPPPKDPEGGTPPAPAIGGKFAGLVGR